MRLQAIASLCLLAGLPLEGPATDPATAAGPSHQVHERLSVTLDGKPHEPWVRASFDGGKVHYAMVGRLNMVLPTGVPLRFERGKDRLYELDASGQRQLAAVWIGIEYSAQEIQDLKQELADAVEAGSLRGIHLSKCDPEFMPLLRNVDLTECALDVSFIENTPGDLLSRARYLDISGCPNEVLRSLPERCQARYLDVSGSEMGLRLTSLRAFQSMTHLNASSSEGLSLFGWEQFEHLEEIQLGNTPMVRLPRRAPRSLKRVFLEGSGIAEDWLVLFQLQHPGVEVLPDYESVLEHAVKAAATVTITRDDPPSSYGKHVHRREQVHGGRAMVDAVNRILSFENGYRGVYLTSMRDRYIVTYFDAAGNEISELNLSETGTSRCSAFRGNQRVTIGTVKELEEKFRAWK